ncbi:hypothetical protein Leryth_024149 [Lithospermum erythrorhizon]|nr:hypothetical protein Leryth_024149 [Lithospermum erythrorhizon]
MTEDESILKDDVRSLKAGIDFLRSHHLLLINKYLANRMKDLAAHVKHTLTTYQRENEVLDMVKLEDVYVSFLIQVKTFVNSMTFCKFQDDIDSRHNYREHIYLLLENILEALSCWYDNYNTTTALSKKVGELRMVLMYYKPLCRCLAQSWHLDNLVKYAPLDLVLSKAVVATFLLLVNETNIESQILSLKRILRHDYECSSDIYVRFLEFNSSECSSNVKGQFYILDNLIDILGSNSDSLNEANNHLHVELTVLRTFVANQIEGEMLDHFLGLTAATEAICYKAVPIVVSCYMEEVELEEHMRWKLNDILADVIGQIKMIKRRHGSQQIKLYDYPRVDGLGYLEFFLVHLKELQVHEKISVIRSEIEALHKNIHCLMSSPKTQEKLPCEGLWETIVRLAYQVEYVIDLYLVIPDSRCISTFLNIVEDIKEIIEILLSRPDKSHLVEEVAVTASSHNHSMPLQQNNEVLGFKEEIDDILNYLLEGEEDLQVISVVAMAGAGKTSLVKHLFNESLKVQVAVSKSYQTRGLLLTLLNQIKAFEFDIRKIEDQDIADELCRSLKKCRYLVVIDDVWDVAVWNDMSQSNTHHHQDHNVASETKSKIHELRALSEDESWKLLQSKLSQQENLPKTLVIIAKEVAKSCKGLPLSIVVIGGLLSNTARNEEMWNQIAKDVTSNVLNDPQGKCEDILELSYNDLPNHLKSCLLYLGVFPEDHKILVSRLVRLWVAEGLVRGEITSEECVEEVGKRYVDDLIARSLAIPIKEKTVGGVKIFSLTP